MKAISTTIVLAAITVNGMAQFNTSNKVLFERKTFPLSAVKNLDLTTSGGTIYAEGATNGEAILEVYVSGNNGKSISLEDAKQRIADNYKYASGLDGNTLFAKVESKNKIGGFWGGNKNNVSISYKVIVPIQTSSKLNTSGGSIQVLHLKGEENLNTSGGSLTISDVNGHLKANTSGGSVTLKQSAGELAVSTSGGSLHLENLKGNVKGSTSGGSIEATTVSGSLSVSTSGGSINLKNIAATTTASTSGGSVHADFTDPGEGIKLSSSGGGIHIHVPKNKGYDLDLRGDRVNISNVAMQGSITKSKIVGRTNGGGIQLQASTSGGSVNVDMD
ncbi:MAG: hypothetical protein QM610_07030 [Chitinophagaceae bacterium]